MKDCRFCINWVDENLDDIELAQENAATNHLFFGCKIYGNIDNWQTRAHNCLDYRESAELYAICSSCKITTPKICISMGVCVNCLNTDLFCVEQCVGEDLKKFCTHFVRLQREGIQLLSNNIISDLFPETPERRRSATKTDDDLAEDVEG
ncbi:MAG: hypothetical protein HYR55_11560 [Acidobacteria bacterium]|nr:hypothetical protein [Acidobacteriota bacterium]MBI3657951.1 hypothetical protein [Acidobacteriota bacterium]